MMKQDLVRRLRYRHPGSDIDVDEAADAIDELLEVLMCVAMSPIDFENDGECCMRVPTQTVLRVKKLVQGVDSITFSTESGQIVTDAAQTSAMGGDDAN